MKNSILTIISAALLVTACSGNDEAASKLAEAAEKTREQLEQNVPEDVPDKIGEAVDKIGDALSGGQKSVPVDKLKALLPEELAGLKRVSHEAQRAGVGITVSKAQAQYGDTDNQISLLITDLGAASGLAAMTRNMFEGEIDKEDASGFERTTTYKGYQSYQRVIRGGNSETLSEIMVFVNDRFTVQLDGQNMAWDDMMAALDQIDLAGLEALAGSAVAAN